MAGKSRVRTGSCSNCKSKKVKVVKVGPVQVCIEDCLLKTLRQPNAAKHIKLSEVTQYLSQTDIDSLQTYPINPELFAE